MTSPDIPTVRDFVSDVLTHSFDDMFVPPGLTNFVATAQVDHDVVAVRSIAVPPLSHGDTITGTLYLNGWLFRAHGCAVDVIWRPDRVVRRAEVDGLTIETVTACPPGAAGVVVDIQVTNQTAHRRTVDLDLALASTVTQSGRPWLRNEPPDEPNVLTSLPGRTAVVGRAEQTSAVSVQGLDHDGHHGVESVGTQLVIEPGGTERAGFVHVVATAEPDALAEFDRLAADVPAAVRAAEAEWDRQLEAAFTPGSGEFSGSLPVLRTSSDALRRLYWWGVLGVIWFRRDNPASVLGRTYDTLMPRCWQTVTYIWDYSLSSMVHALLDPEPMRRQIDHWVSTDIHTQYGTEWLTGSSVGMWYAVNDYAMTRLVRDYVRFSGDHEFIRHIRAAADGPERTIRRHVDDWASAWKTLRSGSPLADYGGIGNLLECVSTYVHEVASLNAANVWSMRVAAEIADLDGDVTAAAQWRAEADALVPHVGELYVADAGYFHARHPDGALVPVRHCYDFCTVGTTIPGDLTPRQREQMVDFFRNELQTPAWMRALSPRDRDATFSIRPDHQFNGAYPAWPADAARALIALGASDVALDWLPGLARSANQGPPGQAHFVEDAWPPVNGGAVKAPPQNPYRIDWACSSAGAWVALIIESVFGVAVGIDGEVHADPCVQRLDPDAELAGLVVGGVRHDVRADGTVTRSSAQAGTDAGRSSASRRVW